MKKKKNNDERATHIEIVFNNELDGDELHFINEYVNRLSRDHECLYAFKVEYPLKGLINECFHKEYIIPQRQQGSIVLWTDLLIKTQLKKALHNNE